MTAYLPSVGGGLGPVPESSSFVKAFAAVAAACVCALRTRGLLAEAQAAARLSDCEKFYLKGRTAPSPALPLEAWADDFFAAHADKDGHLRAVFSRRRILAAAGDLAAVADLEVLASVLRGSIFAARRRADSAEEERLLRFRDRIGDFSVVLKVLPLEEDAVFPLASIVGLPLRPDAGSFDVRAFGALHAGIARIALAELEARGRTEGGMDGDGFSAEDGGIGEAIALSLTAVGRVIDLLSGRSQGEPGARASRSSSLGRNRLPFP